MVVIVHPQNPRTEISAKELNEAFRLERQHWEAGRRIYLILTESGSREKNVLLKRVYKMSDGDLKQYWLGKLYRGEIAAFPRIAQSGLLVKRLVAQAQNAISVIDQSALDSTVKALTIDGKRAGEPGYLLRE